MPEYAGRPMEFCQEVLGFKPWENPLAGRHGQADIIRSVLNPATSCRSGHKCGKSTAAAALAWYWFCTKDDARVVMTAPGSRQVRQILWRETRRLHQRSRVKIECKVNLEPSSGINAEDGRQIIGFTADTDEAFSGISGANVLYLVDEATGISEPIFEAIEGNRAGGAYVMYFANPTRTDGTFFDSHHKSRRFFTCLHIDSADAATYAGYIPGMATEAWVAEKGQQWGIGSHVHEVRVRGNFPPEGSNTVIALSLVDEAKERWHQATGKGDLVLGVDVAREGDDETVIQPMRGDKALKKTVLRSRDGVQIAGAVANIVKGLRNPMEHGLIRVNVDVIGVGASVVDQLVYNHAREIAVCPVNVSMTADDEDKYHNLRTQLHYACRDWMKEGGSFEEDAELEGELVAPTFKFDARGRYQVEEKKEIKKRLGRSPDRADALQLAVYRGRFITDHKIIRAAGRFTRARR